MDSSPHTAGAPGSGHRALVVDDEVWAEPWVGNDNLVDVHVGRVRHQLRDDPADPRFVFTVRSVGYRMGSGL